MVFNNRKHLFTGPDVGKTKTQSFVFVASLESRKLSVQEHSEMSLKMLKESQLKKGSSPNGFFSCTKSQSSR